MSIAAWQADGPGNLRPALKIDVQDSEWSIEEADAILLIGSDPRREASVLNARIRRRWRMGGLAIARIGEPADLTYPLADLGASPEALAGIAAGRHAFAATLQAAQKPLLLIGQGALIREDGLAMLSLAAKAALAVGAVKEGWNGFAVLHTAAARVGALDLGFVPGEGGLDARAMAKPGALDLLFLLGADEIDIAPGAFVVYQGTHGDRGAHRADVILPGAAYTEKSGTYVNTEGRAQLGHRAVFPPGEAREDWAILRALSQTLGATLPFNSLAELRMALDARHARFAEIDAVSPANPGPLAALAALGGAVSQKPLISAVQNLYLTNPIARASAVMAECAALIAPLPMAAE